MVINNCLSLLLHRIQSGSSSVCKVTSWLLFIRFVWLLDLCSSVSRWIHEVGQWNWCTQNTDSLQLPLGNNLWIVTLSDLLCHFPLPLLCALHARLAFCHLQYSSYWRTEKPLLYYVCRVIWQCAWRLETWSASVLASPWTVVLYCVRSTSEGGNFLPQVPWCLSVLSIWRRVCFFILRSLCGCFQLTRLGFWVLRWNAYVRS